MSNTHDTRRDYGPQGCAQRSAVLAALLALAVCLLPRRSRR